MNLQLIEKIIARMEGSGVACLELERTGFRLQLRAATRHATHADSVAPVAPANGAAMPTAQPEPVPSQDVGTHAAQGTVVTAPACGRLLHAHPLTMDTPAHTAKKGEAIAFLQVGPLVSAVAAPCDGLVCEWLAGDRALVGYGTALLRFKPGRSA